MATFHSWDNAAWWDANLPDGDGEDLDSLSPHECGETLFEYLVSLKQTGATVHENTICLIAYWATKAGATGVEALSFGPGKQTGAYSKHLDNVLGTRRKDEQFYMLDVPVTRRADQAMVSMQVPFSPPRVCVQNELNTNPSLRDKLKDAVSKKALPPVYFNHDVVQASREDERVWPLAVYTDGFDFTRTDSCIALWVYNIISGVRHVCIVMR